LASFAIQSVLTRNYPLDEATSCLCRPSWFTYLIIVAVYYRSRIVYQFSWF